jgi:hypothetical protein
LIKPKTDSLKVTVDLPLSAWFKEKSSIKNQEQKSLMSIPTNLRCNNRNKSIAVSKSIEKIKDKNLSKESVLTAEVLK